MKRSGLLLGALTILASACSSGMTQTSSVQQGGFATEPAAVVEKAPAPEQAPPQASREIPPAPAPPAPPASVASAQTSPPPAYTPSPILAEDAYPPVSGPLKDEVAPVPELVGPEDEALIEKMHSGQETAAAPAVDQSPEIQYDIPLELHPRVLDYIELFQTSRRQSFTTGLARSKKYEDIIVPILRREGVPTDLYYLALIESAFNPRAYSRAKATGIWQFMYATGKAYDLHRTHWVDERRDPEKATRAAARHLKDLHDELGSWPLALAAYNAGVNRVKRDIRKAGTRDFWKLRLPSQTKNYVPAFFAALIIAKEPERYGFNVTYEAPVTYETIEVDGGTRLSLVAAFCSTSLQEIRNINPEIRQGCAPPGRKYSLNIPPGRKSEVAAGLARTPKPKITGWGSYTIRSGDTLSTIANSFGTTVTAIQEVNNLPGHLIRAGDRLVIPNSSVAGGSIPSAPDYKISIPTSGTYRVRRGDSLWSISRRFGVPLEQLMATNGIGSRDVLQISQVVALRSGKGTGAVALSNSGGSSFYRIRKGDNLWSISRRFNTDVDVILRANRMRKGQTIFPGEQLIIPGSRL
jgi:membrane-bound lytic murein transglycosylase D